MESDQSENILIEKSAVVLDLVNADKKDKQVILNAKKIDADFLKKANAIFDSTEPFTICSHAFYTWRNTVDDETVISFIDDWINWKKQNISLNSKIATSNKN